MWKNQDFFVTKILREINFGEFTSSKTAVFGNFSGSDICWFGKFQPSKSAKNHKNQNSQPLNVLELQVLHF